MHTGSCAPGLPEPDSAARLCHQPRKLARRQSCRLPPAVQVISSVLHPLRSSAPSKPIGGGGSGGGGCGAAAAAAAAAAACEGRLETISDPSLPKVAVGSAAAVEWRLGGTTPVEVSDALAADVTISQSELRRGAQVYTYICIYLYMYLIRPCIL